MRRRRQFDVLASTMSDLKQASTMEDQVSVDRAARMNDAARGLLPVLALGSWVFSLSIFFWFFVRHGILH